MANTEKLQATLSSTAQLEGRVQNQTTLVGTAAVPYSVGGGVSSWNDLTDKPFETVTVRNSIFGEITFDKAGSRTYEKYVYENREYIVTVNGKEYVGQFYRKPYTDGFPEHLYFMWETLSGHDFRITVYFSTDTSTGKQNFRYFFESGVGYPATLSIDELVQAVPEKNLELNVFVGTAGATSFEEFVSAYKQGKACILRKPNTTGSFNTTYLLSEVTYNPVKNTFDRLDFLCVSNGGVNNASISSTSPTVVTYSESHRFLTEDDLPEIPDASATVSKVLLAAAPLEDESGKYALVDMINESGVVMYETLMEVLMTASVEVLDMETYNVLRWGSFDVYVDTETETEYMLPKFTQIGMVDTDAGRKLQVTTLTVGIDSMCTKTVETF